MIFKRRKQLEAQLSELEAQLSELEARLRRTKKVWADQLEDEAIRIDKRLEKNFFDAHEKIERVKNDAMALSATVDDRFDYLQRRITELEGEPCDDE